MAAIWKFQLKFSASMQKVSAPRLGKAVFFGIQNGVYCVWAKVQPGEPDRERQFQIVGTGDEIPLNWRHVGTVQNGDYVWHLFQDGPQ